MPSPRLDYEVTMEDVVAFNRFHHKSSPHVRRQVRIAQLGGSAALLVAGGALALLDTWVLAAGSLLASVVYGFTLPWHIERTTKRNVEKLFSEGDNPSLLGPHTLELADDGLVERTVIGEQKTHWVGIQRIAESETHTFIYTGALTAHIVPRARLEAEAYQAFIDELERRRDQLLLAERTD